MKSDPIIDLGRWSQQSIDRLLAKTRSITPGLKIRLLSEAFLATPYEQATLVGDLQTEERLVINLAGVDCFTFLDYVEALRRSRTFRGFIRKVQEVRYRSGILGYATRNHFFTDWIEQNASHIKDVTAEIGGEDVRTVSKWLNKKDDGTGFVQGLPFVERKITYLPANSLLRTMNLLRTGDYLGIYSAFEGLDVSHTGIVVGLKGIFVLRHASSAEDVRQVIDQDLMGYLIDKPGIIILRPH